MAELIVSRRKFLVMASSFMAVSATPTLATTLLPKTGPRFSSRRIHLLNAHSDEGFEGVYWREGAYDEKALMKLSYLLRDKRNDKEHPIDPSLLDLLHRLQTTVDVNGPYKVICGYRSKETNAKLHRKSRGVAKNSLHVKGKAIDIRLSDVSLKELKNAACSLKAGGVGYYPKSNFIHVDIRSKPTYWG
jgi:uncharacterized protein YcbK (DUF882 family)